VLDEVNFQKDPALADLGPRHDARVGLLQQRDRVDLQEVGSLLQGEGTHGVISRNRPSRPGLAVRARYVLLIRNGRGGVRGRSYARRRDAQAGLG